MLVLDGKTDLNQFSLTGARAIAMIGLLIVAPRSLEEIRQKFIELHFMDESHSDDILRIDLNTIKNMGCEISRSSAKTDFKYVLTKHPFSLPLDSDDIKALKKVYNDCKSKITIPALIDYHNLFAKIADYIDDDSVKESLLGISLLKYYDTNLLENILSDCQDERTIKILYTKATSSVAKEKEVVAQKLVINNNKIYLYCFDTQKQEPVMLNFRGIKSVLSRKMRSSSFEAKTTKVIFFLKNISAENLSDEETIINADDNGYLIEGDYYNQFIAIQRILSFGSDCTVQEPIDFKNLIISKLKEMRKIYE